MAASLLAFSAGATPSSSSGPVSPTLEPKRGSCGSCHSFASGTTHPLNVAADLGAGLPLGTGNTVQCWTCHYEPDSHQGHSLTGDGAGLRKPAGELCRSCHAERNGDRGVVYHALSLGRAHFDARASTEISEPGLDRESRTCLTCHDGSAAGSASVREKGLGVAFDLSSVSSWNDDHPIGVEYGGRMRSGATPQFQSKASLPPSVQLYGGKVGCGSCHSLYSGQAKMLAVDPRRGRLCLSCHIK